MLAEKADGYEVLFYDYGNTAINTRDQLKELPSAEADVPRFAFQVQLDAETEKIFKQNADKLMEAETVLTITGQSDNTVQATVETVNGKPLQDFLKNQFEVIQEETYENVVDTVIERWVIVLIFFFNF